MSKLAVRRKNPVRLVGRPSSYDGSKLQEMVKLFSEGAGKAEIAANVFKVSRETFRKWENNPPDKDQDGNSMFLKAMEAGLTLSQAFWEREARLAIHDKSVNSTMLIFNLKNRFPADWRDRHEIAQTVQPENTYDDFIARLEATRRDKPRDKVVKLITAPEI